MSEEMEENEEKTESGDCEEPMVFRMVLLPLPGRSTMDRRTFIKGTAAAVGAASLMTILSSCEVGGGASTTTKPTGAPTGLTEPTMPSATTSSTSTTSTSSTTTTTEPPFQDGVCHCHAVCPCEGVGACECDAVAGRCQWGCECHTVCPCEAVSGCACDAVHTSCKPGSDTPDEFSMWVGSTCTCDTVTTPACPCENVCTCVSHCTCDGQGQICTCDTVHYWYPT